MKKLQNLKIDKYNDTKLGCRYPIQMMEHFKLFEPIIWLLVEQYHSTEVPHSKKKLKEALKDSLKKMTDWPVSKVSKSVMALCHKEGIDPFQIMWPQRNILGKHENKSLLVWEHTTPLSEFFETLISCKSQAEVGVEIENYSGVCWITREEDNRLNKVFKQNRRNGWYSAYQQCGINVINKK